MLRVIMNCENPCQHSVFKIILHDVQNGLTAIIPLPLYPNNTRFCYTICLSC